MKDKKGQRPIHKILNRTRHQYTVLKHKDHLCNMPSKGPKGQGSTFQLSSPSKTKEHQTPARVCRYFTNGEMLGEVCRFSHELGNDHKGEHVAVEVETPEEVECEVGGARVIATQQIRSNHSLQ